MRGRVIGAWAFGCLTGITTVISLLTHGAVFWVTFVATLTLLVLSLLEFRRTAP